MVLTMRRSSPHTEEPELVLEEHPDPKAIGRMLRELRDQSGMTQHEIAAAAHAIPGNLSRLESGRTERQPTLETLCRYFQAAGFDLVIVARPRRLKRHLAANPGDAPTR